MADAPRRRLDAKKLTAEVNRQLDAELPEMTLLADPVIGSIVRLETELVVQGVLAALDTSTHDEVRVPAECRHTARLAAGHGVPLELVTRAYRLGHAVLQDALLGETASSRPGRTPETVRERLRRLFVVVDALIEVIAEEYAAETKLLAERSSDGARLRSVQRILRNTPASPSLPFYPLHRTHTAVVATGPIRHRLATLITVRPGARMTVDADNELSWAWISDLSPDEVASALRRSGSLGAAGVGGPAAGAAGFRQAHQQATLAHEVAVASRQNVTGYWDAGVTAIGLASRNESHVLVMDQLGDLATETARNKELCRTLAAYAESGHSVRSAAAALAVSERTVSNRLAAARRILPASTNLLSLELALALRLRSALGDALRPTAWSAATSRRAGGR